MTRSLGSFLRSIISCSLFARFFWFPSPKKPYTGGCSFRDCTEKSRLLAYLASTLVFAAIHVIGYIGLYDFTTLLLCYIQYLPAGIALCFAYEKADTIAAPILMHIAINQIGMSAMR